MFNSHALSAQLAVAAYPQRDEELFPGALECAVRVLRGIAIRPINNMRFRHAGIVQYVEQAGDHIANLRDDAFDQYAIDLRYELKRGGLSAAMAGRSFALVREVSARTIGMRHYDAQLAGGWAILKGKIAEMDTGEGKTLTATLPACTIAFLGLPVHIITVNDYLAERDAQLMRPVYNALGLTVGVVAEGMQHEERRAAYACDVTYCTNKQIAFDYLRDRLLLGQYAGPLHVRLKDLLQSKDQAGLLLRGLSFAIVDEADSVLVDEAVTPLIISRTVDQDGQREVYENALRFADKLIEGRDFTIGESGRSRHLQLTPDGSHRVESLAGSLGELWSVRRYREEMVMQALRARHLFIKDVHYLVDDGEVKIIDEFTGRLMPERSWQRGLHQLIETKEGCELTGCRETIGQISYQRFFRRYMCLSGMSGTAKETAGELQSVYGIDVVRIESNKPPRRRALPDSVFQTEAEKWRAVVERIKAMHEEGRPVLVGTRSVADSEKLSRLLEKAGLSHSVLNARQDGGEAEIIAQAGDLGRITVATNMAGRGTDICLGGGVGEVGGLHVIATERHTARRIDRQLFGRCGRQGNPGSYEMIVSYEDELMVEFVPALVHRLRAKLHSCTFLRSLLDRICFTSAQKSAERVSARARQRVLKSEEYLSNTLAFSGRLE